MSMPPISPRLAQIKENLRTLLLDEIEDESVLGDWLDKLLTDEIYGQVLCVNLYIDLTKGCLSTSKVASIVNRMAFSGTAPRWTFYQYIENNQSEAIFNHLHGALGPADDQFVRVLPLADMIDYYLRQPLSLPPLSYDAEQEVFERFFNPPPDKRETLGVVTAIQRAKMLNVWVTSKTMLDTLLAHLPNDKTANILRDRLGFSGVDSGKLVCVVYPEEFDTARTFVPTTLDAHSGSLFYVSSGENKWGMTCCLNSGSEGLKERVHEPFDGLTADFKLMFVGDITDVSSGQLDHLLGEAMKRAG
jgi:hypothetical protein